MLASCKDFRQAVGNRLREFRKSRGLSAYRVAKNGGLTANQVALVEKGDTNYTIDVFLNYIRGCDLYIFFGEKPLENPADIQKLTDKAFGGHYDAD